jgi:hypothetical protein
LEGLYKHIEDLIFLIKSGRFYNHVFLDVRGVLVVLLVIIVCL